MVGSAAAGRWLIALALAGEVAPPGDPAAAPPSEELLLFLAEFSDDQGHYVDPAGVEAATEDRATLEAQPVTDEQSEPQDEQPPESSPH